MSFVLVAEDEPEVASLLADLIGERFAAAVEIVPNGALVPTAIAGRAPDLLILDIGLPGLSGLDVFDLVRNDPAYRGVPVLFLTASPEKAATAFALTGTHRVMPKPFDVEALVREITAMLGRSDGPRPGETAEVAA